MTINEQSSYTFDIGGSPRRRILYCQMLYLCLIDPSTSSDNTCTMAVACCYKLIAVFHSEVFFAFCRLFISIPPRNVISKRDE